MAIPISHNKATEPGGTGGTDIRRTKCQYRGRTEWIPEIWLAGRSRARMREGLSLADAYAQSIIDWFEQSDLAAEYERQQRC